MTPEGSGGRGWPELAARLEAAAREAGQAARRPPLSGAASLLEPLEELEACLGEAVAMWRSGNRAGWSEFERALEQWAAGLPVLRAWVDATSGLAAGWAAAAGAGPGYGPAGSTTPEAAPGGVSERG